MFCCPCALLSGARRAKRNLWWRTHLAKQGKYRHSVAALRSVSEARIRASRVGSKFTMEYSIDATVVKDDTTRSDSASKLAVVTASRLAVVDKNRAYYKEIAADLREKMPGTTWVLVELAEQGTPLVHLADSLASVTAKRKARTDCYCTQLFSSGNVDVMEI